MEEISVDFQAGFSDDEVIVTIDDQEIYRQTNLRTDYSIGLADSLKINIVDLPCELGIYLPQKGLSTQITLDLTSPVAIGVSLQDGKLTYRLSDTGYLYF